MTRKRFPDTVTVYEGSGSSQDADGSINFGSDSEAYSGKADVQKMSLQKRRVIQDELGEQVDTEVWFPAGTVGSFTPGMTVEVGGQQGPIRDISEIDDHVLAHMDG